MAVTQGVPFNARTVYGYTADSIVLLDLDAAGLDPKQPCPPDFMQFIYDNSQAQYLTLWSAYLLQPDGPALIRKWIDGGETAYRSRTIKVQMAPASPEKPVGDGITEVTYAGSVTPAAPVNVDIPAITGDVAGTLACTMGNWLNEPTEYAYAWSSGGAESTYVVQPGDAGTSITCVVTATNAGGSTAAPPSNAIAIPGAARAAEVPKEEPKEEHTRSRRDYGKRE